MCRLLEVSKSGYYAWQCRPPSKRQREDSALCQRIEKIHRQSRGTYGSPRVQQELKAEGSAHRRKRVARLMRLTGLVGVSRRKIGKITRRDLSARPAPDLVRRNFSANGPDQPWVADITHVATWAGFLYLAVVLDVWSRKIVGWSMRTSLKVEIVLEALENALGQRKPGREVIHHSDQGSQYTSKAFGKRCREAGVRPSMGSVGDCYDNAMCESFFATLECELLDRESFRTVKEASMAIFDYIEGWYNTRRRH
jgi:putative transposase